MKRQRLRKCSVLLALVLATLLAMPLGAGAQDQMEALGGPGGSRDVKLLVEAKVLGEQAQGGTFTVVIEKYQDRKYVQVGESITLTGNGSPIQIPVGDRGGLEKDKEYYIRQTSAEEGTTLVSVGYRNSDLNGDQNGRYKFKVPKQPGTYTITMNNEVAKVAPQIQMKQIVTGQDGMAGDFAVEVYKEKKWGRDLEKVLTVSLQGNGDAKALEGLEPGKTYYIKQSLIPGDYQFDSFTGDAILGVKVSDKIGYYSFEVPEKGKHAAPYTINVNSTVQGSPVIQAKIVVEGTDDEGGDFTLSFYEQKDSGLALVGSVDMIGNDEDDDGRDVAKVVENLVPGGTYYMRLTKISDGYVFASISGSPALGVEKETIGGDDYYRFQVPNKGTHEAPYTITVTNRQKEAPPTVPVSVQKAFTDDSDTLPAGYAFGFSLYKYVDDAWSETAYATATINQSNIGSAISFDRELTEGRYKLVESAPAHFTLVGITAQGISFEGDTHELRVRERDLGETSILFSATNRYTAPDEPYATLRKTVTNTNATDQLFTIDLYEVIDGGDDILIQSYALTNGQEISILDRLNQYLENKGQRAMTVRVAESSIPANYTLTGITVNQESVTTFEYAYDRSQVSIVVSNRYDDVIWTPYVPIWPGNPGTIIDEEEVPQGQIPEIDDPIEDFEIEIDEETPPLAELPQTGGADLTWLAFALLGVAALALILILPRRRTAK